MFIAPREFYLHDQSDKDQRSSIMKSTLRLNVYLGYLIMHEMTVILHQTELHTFAAESMEHELDNLIRTTFLECSTKIL
jgi:hypothetical protein